MSLKKRFILIFIFAIITMAFSNMFMLDITAVSASNSAEIVMEVDTNRIVYSYNADAKKYMASTTKILTAIVIIENCNLNEVVEVNKQTTGIEGSSIYLEAGEKLTVKQLLYGLMLRSGNDCAQTLAVHCSKNISNFAALMNQTALKIGANNSNFVNPHGLHDDNHYTTANDLALISCYAMKNQTFREIVATKSITIPFTTRNTKRLLINKNKILKEVDGATGIKTGYTKKAGRCLVSSAKRNGIEFVCVVLNCPSMFERSKTLLNKSLDNYKNYKVIDKSEILKFIDVKNGEKCGVSVKNDVILPLTTQERENISIKIETPQTLNKPIKKNKEIGVVKIYCKNNLLFTEKIYTILDIE